MWISEENENQRRAESDQQTATDWKKTALRLTPSPQKQGDLGKKFPKSSRVLKSSHFRHISKSGSRIFGERVCIDYRKGRSLCPRLGITCSKKFGKAHDRNRFKRVVREAFRDCQNGLPSDLEINVSPRNPKIELTKQAILTDLKNLISKLTPKS